MGDLRVAFNTMIDHADLLRQAAKAVNNGDQRTIANLKNRLKTEFGDGDYTTLQAIANAYNHEVTTVISKGHITDSEVGTGSRTLPVDANFQTINQVLNAYQDLGRRKMKQLDIQKQSAINQSQPTKKGQIHPAAQQYLQNLNGNPSASNQRP